MAKEPQGGSGQPGVEADESLIDGPRLTPQGRSDPDAEGEDSTAPLGEGAKKGQSDKAEG